MRCAGIHGFRLVNGNSQATGWSSPEMRDKDNCVWAEFGQINAAGAVGWASQDKDSRPLSELR